MLLNCGEKEEGLFHISSEENIIYAVRSDTLLTRNKTVLPAFSITRTCFSSFLVVFK